MSGVGSLWLVNAAYCRATEEAIRTIAEHPDVWYVDADVKHVPGLLPVNYVWTDQAHYSLMQVRDLWRFTYSPNQDQSIEEALSEPVAQAGLAAQPISTL